MPLPTNTAGRGSTGLTQVLGNLVNGVPVGDHLEDSTDPEHTILIEVVVVVGIVESLGSLTRTNDLTLLGLPHPPLRVRSAAFALSNLASWLAGESIPILGEDHVDATARDGVTQGIEHESIQRSPGCPILELPHYLKGVIVTVTS